MPKSITLVPAYGRDYKSQATVKADFDAGKDFIINDMSSQWDGKYANKQNLAGHRVTIRYSNLRKLMIINVA
jgi:hypothetical protein